MTETHTYTVAGMTCAHCVAAVGEEVAEVPGVTAVGIELASGQLTVTGSGVPEAAVREAVAEAGYEIAA